MRSNLVRIVKAGMYVLLLSSLAWAQDDRISAAAGDQYVISAQAGGVNFIDGKVTVFRTNGTNGHLLKGDKLSIGDRVTTSDDGKAEVLLNPGSYLRAGEQTAFEFLTTSLDDLRVKLKTGSAIFEVIADDDFRVTVLMPRTAVALTRSGVYRLDILQDGSSKLSVWKGKAFVGPGSDTEVKAGRSAVIAGTNVQVAKFDRDEKDPIDGWSKNRAKELASINSRLQRKSLRNTLLSSFNSRGWNLYNSFGLWVFDPMGRNWCFMPFGYGWGSPYGYGYGRDLWSFRMPRYIYWYQPPQTTPGGTTTNPAPPINAERRARMLTPPFQRIENRDSGAGVVNRKFEPGFDGEPSYPGPSTRSVPSSPAPVPTMASPGANLGNTKGKPD